MKLARHQLGKRIAELSAGLPQPRQCVDRLTPEQATRYRQWASGLETMSRVIGIEALLRYPPPMPDDISAALDGPNHILPTDTADVAREKYMQLIRPS